MLENPVKTGAKMNKAKSNITPYTNAQYKEFDGGEGIPRNER